LNRGRRRGEKCSEKKRTKRYFFPRRRGEEGGRRGEEGKKYLKKQACRLKGKKDPCARGAAVFTSSPRRGGKKERESRCAPFPKQTLDIIPEEKRKDEMGSPKEGRKAHRPLPEEEKKRKGRRNLQPFPNC